MKAIKTGITAFLLIGSAIFALSPGPSHLINNPTGWEIREQLVFLTGTLAISFMVLAVTVSARLERINRIIGGLDKAYIMHKYAGICCFAFAFIHWLIEKTPGWLVALNLIPHPGDLGDGKQFTELETMLFQTGTLVAELLFYVFVLLAFIALFNKIPYRFFRITHKIFPLIFFLFAYHSATAQLKENWLSSPGGYLLFLLLALGCSAAAVGLFKQINRKHLVAGKIDTIDYHDNGIIDIQVKATKPIHYLAGQYAFLTFSHDSEPHPFTIASSGDNPYQLRFAIKKLGDFTSELKNHISVGQQISIEGPHGEFKFEDNCEQQIWIAAGIGITPFLARLEYLSDRGGADKQIDFWYCTNGHLEHQFPSSLQELCRKSRVNLHHLNSSQNRYFSENMLKETINNANHVSVWFCGPQKFLKQIKTMLVKLKIDTKNLHYDSFNMR